MFERFTDRGRRVVVLAQEEARNCGHRYVGTEHLLAAMIHEGDGIAGQVLMKDFGFTVADVRKQIKTIIGFTDEHAEGHLPFTSRAKKTMELALREGLQLGHNYIGTEHILLGLIREGEGVGCQILNDVIKDDMPLKVRSAVVKRIGNPPSESVVRIAGTATQGMASAKWGPDPGGEDLFVAWAPVGDVDDLVRLVTAVRDEIAGLAQAKTLLEKFGFTVTAPELAEHPEP